MKTLEVVGVYNTLMSAKLTKMNGEGKIKVVKIIKALKPITKAYEEFSKDAVKKVDTTLRLLLNQYHQGNLTTREMQLINKYIGSDVLGESGFCWYSDNKLVIVASNSEFLYNIILDPQYNVITYYISGNSPA